MAAHSLVARRGIMLSEKGQAEWIAVWIYSCNILEMMGSYREVDQTDDCQGLGTGGD